uniref:mitogen-activated protein kinase kinase n=1 Tax=Panagrellus redivivus TaxID=6233 RepID=A0A7E5A0P4_PANRE
MFVAIKKVVADTNLQAINREVDILAKLKTHSQNFLIAYYGCGVSNDQGRLTYHLCTEVADGSLISLSKIVKNDEFANSTLLQYINYAVVTALDYLYSINIIHRDIKPANILYKLTKQRPQKIIIKLTDFGISRVLVDNGASTVGNATFRYMAPERESNFVNDGAKQRYGVETDIWSLAVTILEMHMRRYPLETLLRDNETEIQLLARFREMPFPILDEVGALFTDTSLKEYLRCALLPSSRHSLNNGQENEYRPNDYQNLKSFEYVQSFLERSKNDYDPQSGAYKLNDDVFK